MAGNKKTAGQLAVEAEQARQRLAEVQQRLDEELKAHSLQKILSPA